MDPLDCHRVQGVVYSQFAFVGVFSSVQGSRFLLCALGDDVAAVVGAKTSGQTGQQGPIGPVLRLASLAFEALMAPSMALA